MKSEVQAGADIKRVGRSGQISLGKHHAGRYFRQERRADGAIVLVPVVVVPESHWTVRDQAKIRRALAWAADNPPAATDVDELTAGAGKRASGARRGR